MATAPAREEIETQLCRCRLSTERDPDSKSFNSIYKLFLQGVDTAMMQA